MRSLARSLIFRIPLLKRFSQKHMADIRRAILAIRCYRYDAANCIKSMNWKRNTHAYWSLSSELIFQYHKLEKGLCLPQPQRFFGIDAARATLSLLEAWRNEGFPRDNSIYASAVETLRAYRRRLDVTPPPEQARVEILSRIDATLAQHIDHPEVATPIKQVNASQGALDVLEELAYSRRSVRAFDGIAVDFALVERALKVAQLSPSACNRQPWHVHFYDKPDHIAALLALQNGNRGFGHTIPLLAVITADLQSFFDASERVEPMLDSGLFLMSFLFALQAAGLSSCCLNWCVTPDHDRKAHEIGGIPAHHTIATFLAIGRAAPDAVVPRSGRRDLTEVVVKH